MQNSPQLQEPLPLFGSRLIANRTQMINLRDRGQPSRTPRLTVTTETRMAILNLATAVTWVLDTTGSNLPPRPQVPDPPKIWKIFFDGHRPPGRIEAGRCAQKRNLYTDDVFFSFQATKIEWDEMRRISILESIFTRNHLHAPG